MRAHGDHRDPARGASPRDPRGSGPTVASSVIPVRKRRSTPWSAPAASADRGGELGRTVGWRQPERERRALEPLDVRARSTGAPRADPHGLERGRAPQERLVVGVEDRRGGIDEPHPPTAAASSGHAARRGWAPAGCVRPAAGRASTGSERRQERARLHPRLLDLGLGVGVPDDAAADPEVDPALGDRKRPDRERELEVAVRAQETPSAPIEAPAPDRLERGDQVDRGDLRARR